METLIKIILINQAVFKSPALAQYDKTLISFLPLIQTSFVCPPMTIMNVEIAN